MPRYPDASPTVSSIRGSAFSRLAQKLREHRGEIYPLHVGDTWMEPAEGCRMQDLRVEDHPGMHRYTNPEGMPELIDAIAERTRRRTGASTERGNVLVAAAEGWARDNGYRVLTLRSNTSRIEARPFYESIGFRISKTQYKLTKDLR